MSWRFLHPTDFSAPSRQAFELACGLAGQYGAKLILVHVLTPPPTAPLPYGEVNLVAEEDAIEEEARKVLAAHTQGSRDVDPYKMFLLAKQKLAAKRGFIL